MNIHKTSSKSSIFLQNSIALMNMNSYPPSNNSKKYLTIVACNTDSEIKLNATLNNLVYLLFPSNDVIVIDSVGVKYGDVLKEKISSRLKAHYMIPNDKLMDFGKWNYILNNYDYKSYDYVVFTNDSIIIKAPIFHFYNLMTYRNVELYGHNNSAQIKYHYQSYLFGLKSEACFRLTHLINNKKHLIHDYESLIRHAELELISKFNSQDCFLKIVNSGIATINMSTHFSLKDSNIFFTNDKLYVKLFKSKLLPFIKIKRII